VFVFSECVLTNFETVEQFKYLGTTLTNQNSIHAEIKSRVNSGNACYYSVQNLLSSSLLCKNVKIKIYRTIILLVVLYGCETWSNTFRDECRLSVFENRVLRRIFGPKRSQVRGKWRRLYKEEIHVLYSSLNTIRVIKLRKLMREMQVACMGERRDACRILVRKSENSRLLGRPRSKWENNIKRDLPQVGLDRSGSVY
jgi:hypothetical protein